MAAQWYDVSIPLRPGMTVWPGDPPFQFEPGARIAQGASCNTSVITCSTHTGTHCDAPWHFEDGGKRLDEVDTDLFFGDALLLEILDAAVISAPDLPAEQLPPRVLFKTDNSKRPPDAPFKEDFVALDAGAAQRLVDDGVRLVGIDSLSIAPRGASRPTHHILLANNVLVVEGLLLRDFQPGTYPFVVLPLPLANADGAPCRAFLWK